MCIKSNHSLPLGKILLYFSSMELFYPCPLCFLFELLRPLTWCVDECRIVDMMIFVFHVFKDSQPAQHVQRQLKSGTFYNPTPLLYILWSYLYQEHLFPPSFATLPTKWPKRIKKQGLQRLETARGDPVLGNDSDDDDDDAGLLTHETQVSNLESDTQLTTTINNTVDGLVGLKVKAHKKITRGRWKWRKEIPRSLLPLQECKPCCEGLPFQLKARGRWNCLRALTNSFLVS